MSRGFRRLVALNPVAYGPVVSWTASVGSARWHLTTFLTTRAFYGGDSGPLSDSDLSVFSRSSVVMSILSPSLSLKSPLSRNPVFPSQRAPSGLPELMSQLEQQGSSLALTRFLAMTANDNAHSITPFTLTRSFDNLRFTPRLSSPSANCLLSAGVVHLTLAVQGGRHTLCLCPTHRSDCESHTHATLHRYTGAQSNSKSGSLCLSSARYAIVFCLVNANPCCLPFYLY